MTDAREPAEGAGPVEEPAEAQATLDEAERDAGTSDAPSSLEDDLLHDLNGMLDEEGGGQGNGDRGSAEDTDFEELDAFLEGFEQQQMKDAAGALDPSASRDNAPAGSTPASTDEPAIPEEVMPEEPVLEAAATPGEVDPVESVDPAADFDVAEPEPENPDTAPAEASPPQVPEELDLALEEEEPEEAGLQDALERAAIAEAAPGSVTDGMGAESARAGGGGRLLQTAVGVVAVLGLVGAAVAVLLSYSVDQRLSHIAAAVQRVEQRPVPAAQPDELAKEALSEVRRVSRRVRELAVIVEGPMGHLRDSTDRRFEAVDARLETVEAKLAALDKRLASAQTAAPVRALSEKAAAPKAAVVAKPKGAWVINLASYTNEAVADAGVERLRRAGVKAIKQSVHQGGRTWYRLQVGGFATREDAEAYGRQVEAKSRFKDTWVSKE